MTSPKEKQIVNRISHYAMKRVHWEINSRANKMTSKILGIFHPLQKRESDGKSNLLKERIKEHLYEKFGNPIMQQIPFKISDTIHEGTDYIATSIHKLPPGYKLSKQQIDNFSVNVSRTMAERTSLNIKNHVNGKWEEYKRINMEIARNHTDLGKLNNLNKRDFLENIRNKYKFFQIDPEKKWWIPTLIGLAFFLIVFGIFLPEMTVASGIWQTIMQFGIIQPILNKLFYGYYIYGDSESLNVRSPSFLEKPLDEISGHLNGAGSYLNASATNSNLF